jgi:hypothetical protein
MARKTAAQPQASPPPVVLFYVATETLYVGTEGRRVAAFQPGDKVPFDLVKPNGWADQVRDPFAPDDDDAPGADEGDDETTSAAPADQAPSGGLDEGASDDSAR